MARTPSKITKRDIDKNLYLEIVNEAGNKTNVEKLLDDYVRKDESIGEWQLPDSYRTPLTQRLNNMDSDIETLKAGEDQKKINADVEKRLSLVEKAQGLSKDDEEVEVSPVIGAQVAANASNIATNSKKITLLDTRLTNVEQSVATSQYQYVRGDDQVRSDLTTQITSNSKRMDGLETALAGKRNTTDPITEDDLDEKVRKNIDSVLKISDSTFEALDNMDALVKRIDEVSKKADTNATNIDKANEKEAADKSELLQDILDKTNATKQYVSESEKATQESISAMRNDMTSSNNSTADRLNSIQSKCDSQDLDIDSVRTSIQDVSATANENATKIKHNTDSISSLEDELSEQKQSISSNASDIQELKNSQGKCYGIESGRLLSIGDDDGTIIGKELFIRAYVGDDDDTINSYIGESLSPVLDIRSGLLYNIKTAEEIAAEAQASSSTTGTTTGSSASTSDSSSATDSSTTSSGTASSNSGDADEEATDEEKQALLRYNQIPNYTSRPECRNTFILNAATNMLIALIDSDGVIVSFSTHVGTANTKQVDIEAGSNVEFTRDNAYGRQPVTVYVSDDDKSSKTYGKWLNSEGVATIAYGASSYAVYNNSKEKHTFRILEG